ncbi:MAG: hypothetical protein K8R99_08205 [Actinomycetia bacterium]|nr:hypothetical protein [Actinomycetes bacterium]
MSDFATVIGVDTDALIDQIEHDDGAAEFFERVVGIAAKSRHEPKLRYLARCLANFINTADDAAPDMSWARVEAVEDMEAIHLRLLHQVRAAQNRREEEAQAWLSGGAASDLPIAEATLIEDRRRDRKGLPAGSFQPIMAVLIRSGLVVGKLSVEVDLDVSIDLQDGSMDGSPEVRSEMMYRVTPLGLEVLELIGEQELGGS